MLGHVETWDGTAMLRRPCNVDRNRNGSDMERLFAFAF
jgi:hypothetical protein